MPITTVRVSTNRHFRTDCLYPTIPVRGDTNLGADEQKGSFYFSEERNV
jgi:hypothetical protein